ncbi:protein of unknown function DUF901 [Gloeothece citriformis PCC 7424]|uniref:NYN domain-containing protein n=1 Tax=Gloeothece citriformis (strain PCC 7424) TaxID=65393 RepID=B7KA24_GLOC7|nr:NYN domain-containing protein [Gloeothece citriformis]ACK71380.1 protein of unknown function DUF901 [Gloeothece citriformis PCC 7424]
MASSSSKALLLVDGYNIIGAWSSLKQIQEKQGLDSARRELIETLINYSAHQGYTTQVVFDAQYQKSPTTQEQYTPTLSVCYTAFAQTADTYIEKICASFFRASVGLHSRIIVATSDHAQRLTIVGYGAEWMSAQKLAHEVDFVAHKIRRKHRPRKPSGGRFLVHGLDAKSQALLSQWRHGKY